MSFSVMEEESLVFGDLEGEEEERTPKTEIEMWEEFQWCCVILIQSRARGMIQRNEVRREKKKQDQRRDQRNVTHSEQFLKDEEEERERRKNEGTE